MSEEKLFEFKKKDLPRFAVKILEERRYTDKNKRKFIKNFLKKYLENVDLQKEIDKHYILFKNHKYKGYFPNKDEMDDYVNPDDLTLCYQIGAHPLCQYNTTIPSLKNNLKKNKCGPFYAECNLHVNGKKFTDPTLLIDTGCEITSLFPDYIWDYENQKIRDEIKNSYFNNSKRELKNLRELLKPNDSVDINTGNGICDKILLEFKEPISVSIDKEEVGSQKLLGLDIL